MPGWSVSVRTSLHQNPMPWCVPGHLLLGVRFAHSASGPDADVFELTPSPARAIILATFHRRGGQIKRALITLQHGMIY